MIFIVGTLAVIFWAILVLKLSYDKSKRVDKVSIFLLGILIVITIGPLMEYTLLKTTQMLR